ncbi:MFS transporter [Ruegeria sp. 2012CJ41-6]|uniref:MFS transporter n=1 Tax=Ruegeria spongiae TaxID=2942209 RepID=A0ABT0Q6X1_9RHOB|nr:MFS transporter [Ruegeria spongiae]MCL6284629.1 MFS transporter [Ruegeria spongiae]
MDRKNTLSIAALMVTAFAVGIDFTGAMLLVPAIELAFDTDITSTQWVLNIYALFFAMTMVTGGRLGDMYGHRPVLMVGLVIFLLASVLCLVAPDLTALIGARALQGIGSGLIWPCTLAFGATRIAKPEEQGLVMGLILSGVTIGNVIGPLISGVAISFGDWRYFFAANVVLAIVSMITIRILMPKEQTHKTDEHLDLVGVAVLAIAVLLLLYSLDVGADLGWSSPPILVMIGVSFALVLLFPTIERHVKEPLIIPQMLRNREFMITLSLNALQVPAIFIALLYFPQYMQKTLAWTPMASAIGLVPMTALLCAGSIISGRLYNDFGPKRLLLSGYTLSVIGAATVVVLPAAFGYFQILPGMILIGIGSTLSLGPAGTAAMSAVKPERAGLVGGLSFMVHLVYGALAVAFATALMYSASLTRLGHDLAVDKIDMTQADQRVINGGVLATEQAKTVVSHFDTAQIAQIKDALGTAFSSGMDMAFVFACLSALVGLLMSALLDEKKLQSSNT